MLSIILPCALMLSQLWLFFCRFLHVYISASQKKVLCFRHYCETWIVIFWYIHVYYLSQFYRVIRQHPYLLNLHFKQTQPHCAHTYYLSKYFSLVVFGVFHARQNVYCISNLVYNMHVYLSNCVKINLWRKNNSVLELPKTYKYTHWY